MGSCAFHAIIREKIFKLYKSVSLYLDVYKRQVLGLPLGLVLVRLMSAAFTTDLYTLNEPARIGSILLALVVTVLFVLAAQLITYRRIRDLDFIQALKTRIS